MLITRVVSDKYHLQKLIGLIQVWCEWMHNKITQNPIYLETAGHA